MVGISLDIDDNEMDYSEGGGPPSVFGKSVFRTKLRIARRVIRIGRIIRIIRMIN